MTVGEKYGPAMDVSTVAEAAKYFHEVLIRHCLDTRTAELSHYTVVDKYEEAEKYELMIVLLCAKMWLPEPAAKKVSALYLDAQGSSRHERVSAAHDLWERWEASVRFGARRVPRSDWW